MKKLSLYLLQLTNHPETRGKVFSDCGAFGAQHSFGTDYLFADCLRASNEATWYGGQGRNRTANTSLFRAALVTAATLSVNNLAF